MSFDVRGCSIGGRLLRRLAAPGGVRALGLAAFGPCRTGDRPLGLCSGPTRSGGVWFIVACQRCSSRRRSWPAARRAKTGCQNWPSWARRRWSAAPPRSSTPTWAGLRGRVVVVNSGRAGASRAAPRCRCLSACRSRSASSSAARSPSSVSILATPGDAERFLAETGVTFPTVYDPGGPDQGHRQPLVGHRAAADLVRRARTVRGPAAGLVPSLSRSCAGGSSSSPPA